MNPSQLLSIASFAGMVIMAIAFFWTQWKNGSNGATKELNSTTQEVISTFKVQVEQLKVQNLEYREDVRKLTLEIGQLQGTIAEKERKNKELEALLLAQNPDLKNFYKEAPVILNNIVAFMQKMNDYFEASQKELHQQTLELKNQSELLK